MLVPFQAVPKEQVEEQEASEQAEAVFDNPVHKREPISVETALIFGEPTSFYQVINPNKPIEEQEAEEFAEDSEIVGLNVINIEYDNDPCSVILFRNWSNQFKYQFAKSQQQC